MLSCVLISVNEAILDHQSDVYTGWVTQTWETGLLIHDAFNKRDNVAPSGPKVLSTSLTEDSWDEGIRIFPPLKEHGHQGQL